MTIKQVSISTGGNKREFIGLGADVKPISTDDGVPIGAGSKLTELDGVKKSYTFDGGDWVNTFIPTLTDERGYSVYIPPEHYRLHNGEAYSSTSILTNLNAGSSLYLEYVIPAGKTVAVQGFNIESDRLIKTEFYEAPTITDGTVEIPIIQRKRVSANTAGMKIYNNPTGISGGTLLRTLVYGVIDGQGNNVKPLPPNPFDSYGFNLKPDTKYVVKLTNLSAAATTLIYFNVDIYEF